MSLARTGSPAEAVRAELEARAASDADWRRARTWSLVYQANPEVEAIARHAFTTFMATNGLSPTAFPSLRRFENDVLQGVAELLHAPDGAAGSMTSGGTESLLLAVKTARDWARDHRPEVQDPEMIVPRTAHPALHKAGHYFGVKPVLVPVRADFRTDVAATRELMSPRTILLVASAPAFPQGILDPVGELAALAEDRGILCHVDACLGGFMLPWLEHLGRRVPPWDFRVRGVTSISADLHKYGYAAKGASTILYRTQGLRRYQFFAHPGWPGGAYASPTTTGTRSGGAIAAAWAVMRYLGQDGYLRLAQQAADATDRLMAGIRAIDDLYVLGSPDMTIVAFGARHLDIHAIGDALADRGWRVDKQGPPAALHLVVTANHAGVVDEFLADLQDSAARAPRAPLTDTESLYGMLGSVPKGGDSTAHLLDHLDRMYAPTRATSGES